MNSWAVLEPPQAVSSKANGADKVIFIKDGFCLPALIFGPLWLLWTRQWLTFLGWLAVSVAITSATSVYKLDGVYSSTFSWLFGIWLALEGNALRASNLQRKGWRLSAIVRGHKLIEAEIRYFHARSATFINPSSDVAAPHTPAGVAQAVEQRTVSPWGAQGTGPDILGVFPEPQGPKS